jgi:hypothetical protein
MRLLRASLPDATAARPLAAVTIVGGSDLTLAREVFGWDGAVLDDWLLFILFAIAAASAPGGRRRFAASASRGS